MSAIVQLIKKKSSSPSVVLASVLIGVGFGSWLPKLAMTTVIISDIYVDMLKMVTIPFMISSIIYSLSTLIKGGGAMGIIGRVIKLLIVFMIVGALLGLLAALVMGPGRDLSQDTLMRLSKLVGQNLNRSRDIEMPLFMPLPPKHQLSLMQLLLAIIPSNIFYALASGDALKILIFSLLFGMVLGCMKTDLSISLTDALYGLFEACLKLTIWLNYLIPLVLVSMVAHQVATSGIEPLRAMLGFLITLATSGLVAVCISFILLRWSTRLPWSEVVDSQRESVIMAIATRSSPACMPAMINSLVDRLGFSKEHIELMVPLGVSLLRLGPVLNYMVATLFIAQIFGKHLQIIELIALTVGTVLTGFASSGMSGIATISLIGIVCSFIGLPFTSLLVLFVAIDPLCNTIRIVVSIVGTNAFAAMACGQKSKLSQLYTRELRQKYEMAS